MFTARDMHMLIQNNLSAKGVIIDTWLKEVVLPSKIRGGYEGAFDCPSGINLVEAEELLLLRGFDVTTWADYQGSFISIKIPPQGE